MNSTCLDSKFQIYKTKDLGLLWYLRSESLNGPFVLIILLKQSPAKCTPTVEMFIPLVFKWVNEQGASYSNQGPPWWHYVLIFNGKNVPWFCPQKHYLQIPCSQHAGVLIVVFDQIYLKLHTRLIWFPKFYCFLRSYMRKPFGRSQKYIHRTQFFRPRSET